MLDELISTIEWEQWIVKTRVGPMPMKKYNYACGDTFEGGELKDVATKIIEEFSGASEEMNPWIPCIRAVRDRLYKETGVYCNACLLNYYIDGHSAIGYHSDRECIQDNSVVMSVSLGSRRKFYFKSKQKPFETIKTFLDNGDACVMFDRCQQRYAHQIVKCTHAHQAGPRISLTFRSLEVRGSGSTPRSLGLLSNWDRSIKKSMNEDLPSSPSKTTEM